MLTKKQTLVRRACRERVLQQRRNDASFRAQKNSHYVLSARYRVIPSLNEVRSVGGTKTHESQDSEEQDDDPDDLISTLSAEAYVEQRLLPHLERCRKLAPALSKRLTRYEVMIFLTSLAGTLLGAVQLTQWIPISVAFGALLASFMQFEALQGRLTAVNSAIQ